MARRFFGLMFAILTATLMVGHAQQPNAATRISPRAESYSYDLLYSFPGAPQGANPAFYGNLMQAQDGSLYGATGTGGTSPGCNEDGDHGCGTVFKISLDGKLTTIYSLCADIDCTEESVESNLIQDGAGNLWGLTGYGGSTGGSSIFTVTPAGEFTTMYSFCAKQPCPDGLGATSGLIEGSDGNFYGSTEVGGNVTSTWTNGAGTIFRITPSGEFTTLYRFCSLANCADGAEPGGTLVQGSDGNFYGTTAGGGNTSASCPNGSAGCGTVFKMTPAGELTTVYTFCSLANCIDGFDPIFGGLVEGSDGNFYGTTDTGGTASGGCYVDTGSGSGCGTFFKITPTGTLTTLYTFCGESSCANAGLPTFALTLASDGNFYGIADYVTVFSATNTGVVTSLYNFASDTDFGGLIQASDGSLYGTSPVGGADNDGFIFSLTGSPSLPAPVQLTFSDSTVNAGNSVKLDWSVLNAFSTTMQQCYAFVQGGATGAGAWTGLQTGALANNIYGGSATITPTVTGTYTYALTCGGIESGFATLTVDASETADLTFTSVTHNLGSVQVGSSTSGVSNYGVKITNTSGAAISATGISLTGSNEFKYQANCPATLAAGAYCEVLFTFAPTSTGTVTANWSIAGLPEGITFNPSNGGTLTGTGVPANGLNLTTSVHNFGNVTVGSSSPVYGTVLTNSYSFPVTLTYTTSGSTASFPLVTNCGAILYAGESCNSNFTFTPKATGFVTETIGVAASYNGNPIAVTSLGQTVTGFTLKGTGQ